MKKVLLTILFIFIIIDIILFFIYIENIAIINLNVFSKKRHFNVKESYFAIPKNQKFILKQDDPNLELFPLLILQAQVVGSPIKKDNNIYLPIQIEGNKTKIKSELKLGQINNKTLVSLTKNGNIDNDLQWSTLEVNKLVSLLKLNDPLYIVMIYNKDLNLYYNNSFCNELCKIQIDGLKKYKKENDLLIQAINGSQSAKIPIIINNFYSLIIYND